MSSRGIVNKLSNHILLCMYITVTLPPVNHQFISTDSSNPQIYISFTKPSLRKEYTLLLEIIKHVVKNANNNIYHQKLSYWTPGLNAERFVCLLVRRCRRSIFHRCMPHQSTEESKIFIHCNLLLVQYWINEISFLARKI